MPTCYFFTCSTLAQHNFGVNTYDFTVHQYGKKAKRYTMKMHDEVCLPTFVSGNMFSSSFDADLQQ